MVLWAFHTTQKILTDVIIFDFARSFQSLAFSVIENSPSTVCRKEKDIWKKVLERQGVYACDILMFLCGKYLGAKYINGSQRHVP